VETKADTFKFYTSKFTSSLGG